MTPFWAGVAGGALASVIIWHPGYGLCGIAGGLIGFVLGAVLERCPDCEARDEKEQTP